MQKGQTVNYHRQGEPLLHPSLEKYIRWGVEAGVKPVISTNGLLLTQGKLENLLRSGLKHLVITLHRPASVQAFIMAVLYFKTHSIETYHFADRSRVHNDTAVFFAGKILDRHEEEIRALLDAYGADMTACEKYLQIMPTHTWAGNVAGTKHELSREKMARRQKNCYFIQRHVVNVRWNGTVVGCCFDSENENELGHIRDFAALQADLPRYHMCEHCDANWAVTGE